MENELTFKDEQGNKLYGYSERDLSKLIFWIKFTGIILALGLLFAIFLFWFANEYHVIAYLSRRCV